ncbi:hypothetical protein DAPPUDRAFT_115188 [Daphnia pulex]|uniref:Uncharacterized protein n=1 Tax=Daphnia pulex TaxID=6669 RepID=E9HKJ1_DAPPU|nr:hypothetical protein DAPPUDRAFT_115188 [Daphnia pulex]|eukprot:EFX67750.1 hypothetical protein DAPPUDRAFT_115188 [Daphnia pulex]
MAAHDIKMVAGAHATFTADKNKKSRAAEEITSKRKCVHSAHPRTFGRGKRVGESVGRRNGRQHLMKPVHTGDNNDIFPAHKYAKVTLKVLEGANHEGNTNSPCCVFVRSLRAIVIVFPGPITMYNERWANARGKNCANFRYLFSLLPLGSLVFPYATDSLKVLVSA